MKQVLLLDGKEFEIKGSTIYENKITSVNYIDENGSLVKLVDSKSNYFKDKAVDDLHSKVIDKDDFIHKIVHSIEEFLEDEEKMLDLKNNEVAEANRELYTDPSKYRYYVDCSIRREEQSGKVDGIIETLNLIKLSLGYKD
ncbi:hypothetical protein CW357_00905 [Rummeliibacillus sp. TYF005]|uniref:hypothetical protein n=1 Tax=Rummeliibacillus sp. TYF005 TaxID=2058214 RepID=UPI000F5395EC|nr:hypothetical protein [Rummeliibacillus sp. TYF005]RPJ97258.1 hypothetical protein CW357_00905 [Rummeliibacillus sp. TYF005]